MIKFDHKSISLILNDTKNCNDLLMSKISVFQKRDDGHKKIKRTQF